MLFSRQFLRKISVLRGTTFRHIYLSGAVNSTQTSPLFILRQRTGIAYNLCREALNKHNNDVEEAEAWLKAQALAHGLQKATKVRGRNTSEGLIGLAVHNNNKIASVIELNCETDFVAKNQIFKDLVLDLTHQITDLQNDCDIKQLPDQSYIEKLSLTQVQLKELDSQIVPIITKLGENIKIHQATHFRVTKDTAAFFGQIHSQSGVKTTNNLELMSGRFGAIVALENLDENDHSRSMKVFGNRLCRHVIGFSPTYIELPDNIRKHLEEAEENRKSKNSNQDSEKSIELSNPDEEQYSDEECDKQDNRDDWPSMMDQQIIMSDDQTVRDYCKENKLSILYFNRFECGGYQ